MLAATLDRPGNLFLESTNADTAIEIAGSAPSLLNELGLAVSTVNPTNLLTQSAAGQGQTHDHSRSAPIRR